jgi:hypothetical protein
MASQQDGGLVMDGAILSCRCGTVKLQFPSQQARVSTECCCNHCYNRVHYLEKLGGPKVPTTKPLLASKFDNRITILEGTKENFFVYKLKPDSLVLNIASTCCFTFLLGRHPGYDANCVTTSSDFPIFDKVDKTSLVPSSRWFTNQWNPERLAPHKYYVGIWAKDDGSLEGDDGWEEVFAAQIAAMERDISPNAKGKTFDELVDWIGGTDRKIHVAYPP